MKSHVDVYEGSPVSKQMEVFEIINKSKAQGKVPTGIFYENKLVLDAHDMLETTDIPLRELKEDKLCPMSLALEAINNKAR